VSPFSSARLAVPTRDFRLLVAALVTITALSLGGVSWMLFTALNRADQIDTERERRGATFAFTLPAMSSVEGVRL
jgi:hypothetical protein